MFVIPLRRSFNQTHQRIVIKFVKNVIELIRMLLYVCIKMVTSVVIRSTTWSL